MEIIKETVEVYPSLYNWLVSVGVPLIVACVPIYVAIRTIKSEFSKIEKTFENQNSVEKLRYRYEVTRNKNDSLIMEYKEILNAGRKILIYTFNAIDCRERLLKQRELLCQNVNNSNWDHSLSIDLRNTLDNLTEQLNEIIKSKDEAFITLITSYKSIRLFLNFEDEKEIKLDEKLKQYIDILTFIYCIPEEEKSTDDNKTELQKFRIGEIKISKELSEDLNIIINERINRLSK
ncbi:hypothetical protein PT226_05255 [Erysipelothrix rhusiopathiae]|nr:hypothetical protein [Erysipelothrix rhusiopathiae]